MNNSDTLKTLSSMLRSLNAVATAPYCTERSGGVHGGRLYNQKIHSNMIRPPLLFLNVLIVATCGLIYELLAGTLASYVLGDSITQFSLIIGIYLFAMGVGSWLSRFY